MEVSSTAGSASGGEGGETQGAEYGKTEKAEGGNELPAISAPSSSASSSSLPPALTRYALPQHQSLKKASKKRPSGGPKPLSSLSSLHSSSPLEQQRLFSLNRDVGERNSQLVEPLTPDFKPTAEWVGSLFQFPPLRDTFHSLPSPSLTPFSLTHPTLTHSLLPSISLTHPHSPHPHSLLPHSPHRHSFSLAHPPSLPSSPSLTPPSLTPPSLPSPSLTPFSLAHPTLTPFSLTHSLLPHSLLLPPDRFVVGNRSCHSTLC